MNIRVFKKDKLIHSFLIFDKNKEDRYFDEVTQKYHSSKFINKFIEKMDNWKLAESEE